MKINNIVTKTGFEGSHISKTEKGLRYFKWLTGLGPKSGIFKTSSGEHLLVYNTPVMSSYNRHFADPRFSETEQKTCKRNYFGYQPMNRECYVNKPENTYALLKWNPTQKRIDAFAKNALQIPDEDIPAVFEQIG